ncbi:MAG TPA: energy-coupling factor ABC transporter ATP-binding protein [Methanoculleus sp.]|nr:energy-coupling factor ABC transporter ATP-binding protein [Methanoculleus sp.]
MIVCTGLAFRTIAIRDLSIPSGHTCVIGPNGSGKSTLLSLLAGIEMPEQGRITIDGETPRRTDVGWVGEFPEDNLIFRTVRNEIASALRFRHLPDEELEPRIGQALRDIGCEYLLDARCKELSGGEKALVVLAAALAIRPKVLVLDEIDSHLDRSTAEDVQQILPSLSCMHVLQSTQNMDTAAGADNLIYLEEGQVRYFGSPEDIFPNLEDTPFYPTLWRFAAWSSHLKR